MTLNTNKNTKHWQLNVVNFDAHQLWPLNIVIITYQYQSLAFTPSRLAFNIPYSSNQTNILADLATKVNKNHIFYGRYTELLDSCLCKYYSTKKVKIFYLKKLYLFRTYYPIEIYLSYSKFWNIWRFVNMEFFVLYNFYFT